jgi:hypothetical protein
MGSSGANCALAKTKALQTSRLSETKLMPPSVLARHGEREPARDDGVSGGE